MDWLKIHIHVQGKVQFISLNLIIKYPNLPKSAKIHLSKFRFVKLVFKGVSSYFINIFSYAVSKAVSKYFVIFI